MFCAKFSPVYQVYADGVPFPSISVIDIFNRTVLDLKTDQTWNANVRDMASFFITKLSGWPVHKALIIEDECGEIIVCFKKNHTHPLDVASLSWETRETAIRIRFNNARYGVMNGECADVNCFFSAVLCSMTQSDRQWLLGQENASELTEETQIQCLRSQLANYLCLHKDESLMLIERLRYSNINETIEKDSTKKFGKILEEIGDLFPVLKKNDFPVDWIVELKKIQKFLENLFLVFYFLKIGYVILPGIRMTLILYMN